MIESDVVAPEWLLLEGDADTVLEVARDCVLFAREADRTKVRIVLRWAELHPATADDVATWGQGERIECEVPINREGCPGVRASAVADLAAALRMTTAGGLYLLDACLELRFRLPRIHRRFEALEVDLAKVRQVTSLTEKLDPAAADHVDRRLARRLHKIGRKAIAEEVASAIVLFQPELATEMARAGKATWKVEVEHPDIVDFASTSSLDATGDSLDLEDFMSGLAMIAEDLARDGDTDTQPQRMAKALGIIGRSLTGRAEHPSPDQHPEPPADDEPLPVDPEEKSDHGYGAGADPAPASPAPAASTLDRLPVPRSPRRRRRHGLVVHAHLHIDPITGEDTAIYVLPGLGVVTEEVFDRWVATHGVTVTRVLDLNRRTAVNQHDPPPTMRDQIKERDRHCVFPGCEVPAHACDLDHIVPYDENGPPGQTNPDGIACLCRMHHLLKTHHGWRYGRLSDGAYLWVSPTGRTYRVDRSGTTWLDQHAA